jgi:thioredoxin 1
MKNINEIEYQEMINSDKLSVIKYFGTWCGPCRVLTPIMEDVIKNYPDINAGEVDIDRNMVLAQKDGIRGVPTVVFYKNGKLLDKMVGLSPAQVYQAKIDSLK